MTDFQTKKQELAERSANILIRAEKEKDVRDLLIESANNSYLGSDKSNVQAVIESFTKLAVEADSEQVRSQTSIQYLKFLGKSDDDKDNGGNKGLNLQININPVKAETIIE